MTRSTGVHVSDALNCPGLRVLGKRFMALLFRASRLNGRDPGLWPQSRPPRASSFELGRQRMADGLEQSLGNLNLIWPTVVREGVWGWLQPLNPPPWKSDVPAQASAQVAPWVRHFPRAQDLYTEFMSTEVAITTACRAVGIDRRNRDSLVVRGGNDSAK
jgi:hypothetical protein